MSQVMQVIAENALEAFTSGLVAGGASYFILKRTSENIDLFGLLNLKEWQADALLVIVESLGADLVGQYALPMIQEKITGSEGLSNMIEQFAPPALTGGAHYVSKAYVFGTDNTYVSEIVLGGGSKFVGNALSSWYSA